MTITTNHGAPMHKPLSRPCFGHERSGGEGAKPPAAEAAPSPLDPLETSSRPHVDAAEEELNTVHFIDPDAVPFEHRGWQPMRRRVMASMIRTGQAANRKFDFWGCGSRCHVYHDQGMTEIAVIPETCHDRFCLPCGARRSRQIAEATADLMRKAASKLMFITLTVRGRPSDSLTAMLDRLREAWKELRRLKGWKNNVRGGVIMLEVKWSKSSGGHWHPHYHLICEGNWIDKDWLSRAWSVITRDSDQVDVQRVTEEKMALRYVSKYASKPIDASFVMRPSLIDEAMVALKGVRLAACFGTWHGTPLSKGAADEEQDETSPLTSWLYAGTVDDLRLRASFKDETAEKLLVAVERHLRIRHALLDRCTSPPSDAPEQVRVA